MMLDNNWYGNRSILAAWCGITDRPAFATILHGWIWEVGPERSHRRIPSAPYLFWNEHQLQQARMHSIANSEAIGAPFLYLCKKMRIHSTEGGTIFLPQHYDDYNYINVDHHRLIKTVEGRFPPPYTISLFFREPNYDSIRRLYEESGWRVFSAGSRSNPEFLSNLWHCLIGHRYVVSNDFSSAIFYGAYLGKSVQIMRDTLCGRTISYLHTAGPLFQAFASPLFDGITGDAAVKMASEQLGVSCLRSPEELCEILGWSAAWRTVAARVVTTLVDLKYGKAIRLGERDR